MEIRMHGIYTIGQQKNVIDLFAYSGKGLPGIEIKGPKKGLEQLKEKFIYISRNRNLKIPMKKYTLCVEGKAHNDTGKGAQYSLLELPLLILFWNMCEFISIHNLHNCLSGGFVSINGRIQSVPIKNEEYGKFGIKNLVLIMPESAFNKREDSFEYPPLIPLEEVLRPIPEMEYL